MSGGILGGAVAGFAGGLAGGLISGFGNALLPGGSGKPLEGAWQGAAVGAIGGAVIGGAIGGIQAAIKPNTNILTGNSTLPKPSEVSSIKKAVSESLDETLNTKTTSTKISENSSITKGSEGVRNQINNAVPESGPINYRTGYLEKVNNPLDGAHNWNRVSIEIVADNGIVVPNSGGGILIQHTGSKQGFEGIFEIIIKNNAVHHQRFIPGGVINGVANQKALSLPSGSLIPLKPWWK